jgi:serine/threonine-protein kinase
VGQPCSRLSNNQTVLEMSKTTTNALVAGQILEDKWIIMELIGKGAMGEVYRAHQTNLKRDVAIKVISEDVNSELEEDPEELDIAVGRFQREVQAMAKVRHPNILNIYDYGEIETGNLKGNRTAFISMEYIPGNSLRFTMAEDGLDDIPTEFVHWIQTYFLPILDGVETLHNNGIIHRDLKPENIFMDGNVPKIADFGLARSQHMKAVTVSLEMLGTLAYMSPEQGVDFKNAGSATDIYALGKILYEAVAGTITEKTLPFTSVTIENPRTNFLHEINKVLLKATSESPAERYQSVAEMRTALTGALSLYHTELQNTLAKSETAAKHLRLGGIPLPWFITGTVMMLLVGLAAGVFYFLESRKTSPSLQEDTYIDHGAFPQTNQAITAANFEELQSSIIGQDGSKMLITGEFDPGEELQPFYVDESLVSNFLFVDFLNARVEQLSVKNGVIRNGDTIIAYIGNDSSGNEAIMYEHGRFHLRDQTLGSNPVTRVTFHGAHLYAASYGKELLSADEWKYAYLFHSEKTSPTTPRQTVEETDDMPVMMDRPAMMHATSSPSSPQQGQIALDRMGLDLKEWVRTSTDSADGKTSPAISYEAGVFDTDRLISGNPTLKRAPWEGFDDVGFRTKIPIIMK